MTPNEHLTAISRRFPNAWKQADTFRQARGKEISDWPAWCFLPMGGWYAVVSSHLEKDRLGLGEVLYIAQLAALGAWRYTQGIYRFHPELYAALVDTEPSGELPVDVLLRLPEWCVYIEAPAASYNGFFAFLESDTNDKRMELRIVFNFGDRLGSGPPIHLGPWTVTEAIDRAQREAQAVAAQHPQLIPALPANAMEGADKFMSPVVSLLLYLCADGPNISGPEPEIRPRHPRPVKTERGWRFFPPPKPRIWQIGKEIGETLWKAAGWTSTNSNAPRRAHIRRAHWHGYWTGPRKPKLDVPIEQQQRRFSYRWLHPMLVSSSEDTEDGDE